MFQFLLFWKIASYEWSAPLNCTYVLIVDIYNSVLATFYALSICVFDCVFNLNLSSSICHDLWVMTDNPKMYTFLRAYLLT